MKIKNKTMFFLLALFFGLFIFLILKPGKVTFSAALPTQFANKLVDARILVFTDAEKTTMSGYADFKRVKVDKYGALALEAPSDLLSLPNVSHVQICMSDAASDSDGGDSESIGGCNNNLSGEHNFDLASCSTMQVASNNNSFLSSLLPTGSQSIFIEGLCDSNNQLVYSTGGGVLPSETGSSGVFLDGNVLTIGDQTIDLSTLGVSDVSLNNNGDGTISLLSDSGAVSTVTVDGLGSTSDIVSTITGNQIAVHSNGDGAVISLNESVTTITDNNDGTFSYVNEAGQSVAVNTGTISSTIQVDQVNNNGDLIANITDQDGTTFAIYQNIVTLVDNGNQTFTFTDEAGTPTIIDIGSMETPTELTLGPGTQSFTYTNEDNTPVTVDISNLETLTSLEDNDDGSFTYTDEDGVDTVWAETVTSIKGLIGDGQVIAVYTTENGLTTEIKETITTLKNESNGVYVYTNEEGDEIKIIDSLGALSCTVDQLAVWSGSAWICDDTSNLESVSSFTSSLTSGNVIGTYEDETGTSVNVYETVTSVTENADGTFTFRDENGVTTTIDISNLETLTSLSINPTAQTITYSDENGDPTTVDIKALETTTSFVDNGNNSFTYTNEDGLAVIIDLSPYLSPWDNPDGSAATQGSGNIEYNDGELKLGQYGQGNVNGLLTYLLGVDANGNVIETPIREPFTIFALDGNNGSPGGTGYTFTPDSYNVIYPNLTWSIESFSGDVVNPTINPSTGEVTYDLPPTPANNGKGTIILRAVDNIGQVQVTGVEISMVDPSSKTTLACNSNMKINSPATADKYTLFARVDSSSVFTDLAKTTNAITGDEVMLLQDGNGNGDVTVRAGNGGPTYIQGGGPNSTDLLSFSASEDDSMQYDTPTIPAAGTPFKFFSVFSIDPTASAGNSTLFASTEQSNNNSLAANTWQISRFGGSDNFGFRIDGGGYTNVNVGTVTGGGDISAQSVTWSGIKDGAPHLMYVNYDGTTLSMYIDGVLELQADPVQQPLGEHFKLFENRAGASNLEGELYEMIHATGSALTDAEALQTQGYFLCKFKLDASLLAWASPFSIEDEFYDATSQFEYQILGDGQEFVYDTFNNVYYATNNVPTPGLGYLLEPSLKKIRDGGIIDAVRVGDDIMYTRGDGSTFLVPVEP